MASSVSSSPPSPFPRIAISQLEGRAQPIHYRQTQLHRLQTELLNSADKIKASIEADEGHTSHEADFEYILVLSEIRQHYDALNPKNELATTRQIELGNSNLSRSKSTSIAYIEPSPHTWLYSVLSPVCAAIAAGNCVIVEVSRCFTPLHTASQPEDHRREHLLKDNSFHKL
jgi:acyl-CoA reductase-like NAD-dependent aldehyde dehydrogenase